MAYNLKGAPSAGAAEREIVHSARVLDSRQFRNSVDEILVKRRSLGTFGIIEFRQRDLHCHNPRRVEPRVYLLKSQETFHQQTRAD